MKALDYIALLLSAAMSATCLTAHGTVLYGLTPTSMDEGDGRLVCFDTEQMSEDPFAPTRLTELATVAGANDFMGGCAMGNLYYGYYNVTNMETQTVVQHFCTIDFESGEADVLAAVDPTASPDGIYLVDMTYEPVSGLLVALENQYSTSSQTILSSLQAVRPDRGTLSLLCDFDRKYSAICADGEGGYYLAEIERLGDGVGLPAIYRADRDLNVTVFMPSKPSLKAESGMAHSMVTADGLLYLVTGRTVTTVNLKTKATASYYLDRDVYGVTATRGTSGLHEAEVEPAAGIWLHGRCLKLARESRIDVYAADGTKVLSADDCTVVLLEALARGIYIVRAVCGGESATLKISI